MRSRSRSKRVVLAAGVVVLLVIWLRMLPTIASSPRHRAIGEQLDRAGVDAGALFYTDHPRFWRADTPQASSEEVSDPPPDFAAPALGAGG